MDRLKALVVGNIGNEQNIELLKKYHDVTVLEFTEFQELSTEMAIRELPLPFDIVLTNNSLPYSAIVIISAFHSKVKMIRVLSKYNSYFSFKDQDIAFDEDEIFMKLLPPCMAMILEHEEK